MKIIKGILKFIINSIMVIAICLLILNITGKKVFYDLLYDNLFKPVVIEETKTITKTEASNQDISKILENKNTEKLILVMMLLSEGFGLLHKYLIYRVGNGECPDW